MIKIPLQLIPSGLDNLTYNRHITTDGRMTFPTGFEWERLLKEYSWWFSSDLNAFYVVPSANEVLFEEINLLQGKNLIRHETSDLGRPRVANAGGQKTLKVPKKLYNLLGSSTAKVLVSILPTHIVIRKGIDQDVDDDGGIS